MKYIILIVLTLCLSGLHAQDFQHEFTDPDDSVKLKGLKLYLEIDSVYAVTDSSGVRFALEIVNEGGKQLILTNPLYDTKLRVRFRIYDFKTKEQFILKEVSRWPNPRSAENIKPYRLEKVTVSGEEVSKDQYKNYWETDTLSIDPGESIRYELNLFEQVLADENNKPYIKPLFKGEYYTIFNVSLNLGNYSIRSKPLRFKLRLE
ncbi:hypothetical protein [Fulvivirga lutea]|uniref:DUF3868 domain-containing protein n=1 Tax=Fulvivirga lutea TaxID=2810512 RepID=A0A975A1R9_9BACT|nr:hypothetical protein [Fulvivirga lutea]QSE98724.1 hypothetical protein JR347_06485 [Fulvivirga lutea]